MGIFSKLFGGRPEDEPGQQGQGPAGSQAAAVEEASSEADDEGQKTKPRARSPFPAAVTIGEINSSARPPTEGKATARGGAAPKGESDRSDVSLPPPPPPPRERPRSTPGNDDLRNRATQIGPAFVPPGAKAARPKLEVAQRVTPPTLERTAAPVLTDRPNKRTSSSRPTKADNRAPSSTPPPRGRAHQLRAEREQAATRVNGNHGSPTPTVSDTKIDASLFDDILGEANAAFDAIESDSPAPTSPTTLAYDASTQQEVTKLFGEVAATHARQIRNFMLELSTTETTKQWAELCRPALASLEKAAQGMDLEAVVKGLRDFRDALNHACAMPGARIGGLAREQLLSRYAVLSKELPDTFKLDEERDRREPIIVQTLLAQVPRVHKVTVDKLYAAGLVSLESLMTVSEGDLSAVSGISSELANAIVERVRAYRENLADQVADPADQGSRQRFRAALEQLQAQHEDFCAAEDDDDRERKRELRRTREHLLHQINLLLAHLGEVDMVHELERAPFASKIERLSNYLRETSRAAHG